MFAQRSRVTLRVEIEFFCFVLLSSKAFQIPAHFFKHGSLYLHSDSADRNLPSMPTLHPMQETQRTPCDEAKAEGVEIVMLDV